MMRLELGPLLSVISAYPSHQEFWSRFKSIQSTFDAFIL